ncbi:MAG: alpha-E domain-containing protein, partial [Mycobacterium sp.]
GAVTVVNTLGSGILESPGLLRFLPELAQALLGETPQLQTAPVYWGGINTERSHLLSKLGSLLIKPVTGGATIVGPALTSNQRKELGVRIEATPWQWVGQELPQFSSAPTDFQPGGLSSASVGMRLFTVAQRGGYAPMIGGLGYLPAPGNAAYSMKTIAAKDIWVRTPTRVTAERILTSPPVELPAMTPSPTRAVSSPRVLSDMFWMGRYAERAENTARLLIVTRERYHEFRYRQDMAGSECVPVLLAALGRITGTDTGASGDSHEMIATAPTTLWSLTADRHRPGALAQSIERLGLAARAVRDQMSNDTWMVLAGVDRAVLQRGHSLPESSPEGEAYLVSAHRQTLAGMLALSGLAAESMVQDVGWTMMDIGKRIERGLALTALLSATLTTVRDPGAEETVTESTLVACESSAIYRRRNLGAVNICAVADLVLLDAENPRSLVYQFERLRADLKTLPGSSGSSRPERLVDEIGTRLRRLDPADLEDVTPDGTRRELADLLDGLHADLRELSGVITATHLSLPGGMQPLWGPDERREMP